MRLTMALGKLSWPVRKFASSTRRALARSSSLMPAGRRGPRFTRWFGYYRRGIGLYREGMAGHALRHNANTRLRNAITDEQQRRHVNYMFGWGGGGAGKMQHATLDLFDLAPAGGGGS